MGRQIVERDQQLAELADAARQAAAGQGCVVLVHGEAGIGKSSVVAAVRGLLPAEGRLLVGHCDDLTTARTLGPFRDLIGSVGAQLSEALRIGDDREAVFAALRQELDWSGHPTVLVIEDVHWADDATLDMLRFLARRVTSLSAVLLLTYRDDEIGGDHPLAPLLGMLPTGAGTRRLALRQLSRKAVADLTAGSGLDPDEVYAVTAGNPFFVSEVLAAGDAEQIPATVVDSVQYRVRRLDPATREAIEQLAVVPTAAEGWLVEELVEGGLPSLEPAEQRGLLTISPGRVSFRHELTRRAVADALPAARRATLQRGVLAALIAQPGVDVARVVHHAGEAGDLAAVLEYGPTAAREAAASGAHREAAAHYRLVLEHPEGLTPEDRADCLEGYAVECYTIGQRDRAVDAQREAVERRRALGDPAALGRSLRWLSRMHWWFGDRADAETTAELAVEVLEPLGPSQLLAMAYSNQAQLDMLAYRPEAVPRAERAVAMARSHGDASTQAHALNNLGCALWRARDDRGRELLEESLRLALDDSDIEDACRAYTNLAWTLLDQSRLAEAESYTEAGLAYAESVEHLGFLQYFHLTNARLQLARGAWDMAMTETAPAGDLRIYRCPVLTIQGRVLARRGDTTSTAVLAEALESGLEVGELQWYGPAAAAAAEDAWLRGEPVRATALVASAYAEAKEREVRELVTELAFFGGDVGDGSAAVQPPYGDEPYGLLAAGRWAEAAELWKELGCPYEHALALGESGDPEAMLQALEQLDALGAVPLAARVRRGLRGLGVAKVPRGPQRSTRDNPAGLTARQLDVLALLVRGQTNAEIAHQLVISVRTADNHVSAVLDKLGVGRRAEAAARAIELGLLDR